MTYVLEDDDAFTPACDAVAAGWVVANLRDGHDVGSIVPACFESYARVFHPAFRRLGATAEPSEASPEGESPRESSELVRWAEVAAANGRCMHRAAEWGSITGSWDYQYRRTQPGLWDSPPPTGSLPALTARALVTVLARFTDSDSRCWFAVWNGKDPLQAGLAAAATIPQLDMLLLRGSINAAALSPYRWPWDDSVNLWWPEDGAWCVGTNIDLMATYVGGSQACVQELLAEDGLEALSVSVDQGVTWDTDTVNPLPPPPFG